MKMLVMKLKLLYILSAILVSLLPFPLWAIDNLPSSMPAEKPAIALSPGDSCSASMTYYEVGNTENADRTATISLSEEMNVSFSFLDFIYERGLGGKYLSESNVLTIELQQCFATDDDESFAPVFISAMVDKQGHFVQKDSKTLRLGAGTYSITFSRILKDAAIVAPLALGKDMVDKEQCVMVSTTWARVVMAISAHSIPQPVIVPTAPYPVVGAPVSEPYALIDVPCNGNYVAHTAYTDFNAQTGMTTIEYYDGFGNNIETVRRNKSPMGRDEVVYTQYDALWRASKTWLPGICQFDNNGAFVTSEQVESLSCETYQDNAPFQTLEYEPSPIGRIVTEHGPGEVWYQHGKKKIVQYVSNNSTSSELSVWMLKPQGADVSSMAIVAVDKFTQGCLSGVKTTDEDGRETIVFKNRQDHIVLKRQVGANGKFLDTYYVYDDNGLLVAIVPPMLSSYISGVGVLPVDATKEYAYLYQYDSYDHIVAKKLPGGEKMVMEYGTCDNVVSIQDGVQRKSGKKTAIFYDVHGRECIRAVVADTDDCCTKVFAKFTGNGMGGYELFGYSKKDESRMSVVFKKLLQVNYYDNYDFLPKADILSSMLPQSNCHLTQGMLTGMLTQVLNSDESVGYMNLKVWCYDYRGNVTQVLGTNQLGGYDTENIEYDFSGHPIRRDCTHVALGKAAHTEQYDYKYDAMGRLLEVSHNLDGNEVVLFVQNEYDELGRVKSNLRNGNASLKSSYTYNVRSWPSSIKGLLFAENLYYTQPLFGGTPSYNGDVSAMSWCADKKNRAYKLDYDKQNRLVCAKYYEEEVPVHHYDVSCQYDYMGNVLALQRSGLLDDGSFGLVDDLSFTYVGNQLQRVDDVATSPTYAGSSDFKDGASSEVEYEYDANGSMVKDMNKGIGSIRYNELNLPETICFVDGKRIEYQYSADGTKQCAKSVNNMPPSTTTIDYCGNYVYEDGILRRVLVEGGYITFLDNGNPSYHFYIQDHLGSNRVVADANGKVEQVNHYYPYGGLMSESFCCDEQRYMYNGKELDRMHGLDWYDYGARMYDPAIWRWNRMDDLCEKHPDVSAYGFCDGNPLRNVDPDGKEKIDLLPNERENDLLKEDFRQFGDAPDVINIWVHGLKDNKGIAYGNINDAKSFDKMLRQKSTIWKKHSPNAPAVIVLHSCATSDFARRLSESDIFKNVLIVAPQQKLIVRGCIKDKKIVTGVSSYEGRNVHQMLQTIGYWRGYKNGSSYNRYSGDFKTPRQNSEKPGAKGFEYDNWWQRILNIF